MTLENKKLFNKKTMLHHQGKQVAKIKRTPKK